MDHDASQIRDALVALLSDIEAMYEGVESPREGGQPEELFGPFPVWKLDEADVDARVSVSWPNLAISLRNAKNALAGADGGNKSGATDS